MIRFDQPVTATQVREALVPVFGESGYEVKQFGRDNQMRIVTQYRYQDDGDNVTAEINEMFYKALEPLMATRLTEDQFMTTQDSPYGIISSDKVGPSVAHDIKVNSVIAVLFSLLAIALYIVIRFKRWQWGVGSVVALLHDSPVDDRSVLGIPWHSAVQYGCGPIVHCRHPDDYRVFDQRYGGHLRPYPRISA